MGAVRLLQSRPHLLKRYVSTGLLFTNHLQTLGLLGSFRLQWPALVEQALGSLGLNALHIPGVHPGCLFAADVPSFWIIATCEGALLLVLLLTAIACFKAEAPALLVVFFTTALRSAGTLMVAAFAASSEEEVCAGPF